MGEGQPRLRSAPTDRQASDECENFLHHGRRLPRQAPQALPPRALRHRRTDVHSKFVIIIGVLEGGLNQAPEPVTYHHRENGYSYA